MPGSRTAIPSHVACYIAALLSAYEHYKGGIETCSAACCDNVFSAAPLVSAALLLTAGIAAESKPAKRFGANFEATDVDDEMSTARIALATGAGLKRDSSPQRRAVEGTEAGRKIFRDLRRAYMRVCHATLPCGADAPGLKLCPRLAWRYIQSGLSDQHRALRMLCALTVNCATLHVACCAGVVVALDVSL